MWFGDEMVQRFVCWFGVVENVVWFGKELVFLLKFIVFDLLPFFCFDGCIEMEYLRKFIYEGVVERFCGKLYEVCVY